jgi:hypothetical protein
VALSIRVGHIFYVHVLELSITKKTIIRFFYLERECVVYWYFFSNHSIVGLVCPTTGLALKTNGLYFTVL